MAFRPEVLSYEDIRRRAEEFLAEFHEERTLPVPVEEIVEFDFEIEIIPMEGILDDLEVDAFLTSDLRHIYVDAFVMEHQHRRFRFSLAHELAHYELHRPLYEALPVRSVRDWRRKVADLIADSILDAHLAQDTPRLRDRDRVISISSSVISVPVGWRLDPTMPACHRRWCSGRTRFNGCSSAA